MIVFSPGCSSLVLLCITPQSVGRGPTLDFIWGLKRSPVFLPAADRTIKYSTNQPVSLCLPVCLSVSLRAVRKLIPVWRTLRLTSGPTPGRNRTCVNTKAATRPSPTPQTEPSTRTAHTLTRYTDMSISPRDALQPP